MKIVFSIAFALLPCLLWAQSSIADLQKELSSIQKKEGSMSFTYGYKLLDLAKAHHAAKAFDKATENIDQIDPIIRFFADSLPEDYAVQVALQNQMGQLRLEQLYTKWQAALLQKDNDAAQKILDQNDWIKRAITLRKEERILDLLDFSNQHIGSMNSAYLSNWMLAYELYRSPSFFNLRKAESLWISICTHREKKYGKNSQEHLSVLYSRAAFYDKTKNTAAFNALRSIIEKQWPNSFSADLKADSTQKDSLPLYTIAEEMPRFPGCEKEPDSLKKACADQNLLNFIYSQVNYPRTAIQEEVQGMAVVAFTVSEYGTLIDHKIIRNPGGGCGEEALRVLRIMDELPWRWTPGKHKGKAVRVRYNMPVRFKLN